MDGTTPLGREERKVVTALFADIVGSTAIGERLDPEDVHEIVQGAIRLVVSAIERYGGTIKDLAGDGVLALFGAPVTHEDDAERAVLAGLRIVEDVAAYGDEIARRHAIAGIGIRVGVESGLVVLGAVGAGSRVEYGATGDALNTAARIQAAAAPGTVLVGGMTQRTVADRFDWDGPRLLELKGKAEPVPAFRAIKAREGAPRPWAAPHVGREAELALAARTVDEIILGRGGVLFVTGEPGIGKSRMLSELRIRLHGAGGTWLEGRCVSYGGATPFHPFRDLLRSWLGVGGEHHDEAAARVHLDERVATIGQPDATALLASVAGLDGPADRQVLALLSPEAVQLRTMEAIASLFVGLAAQHPTVVAVEDLHWADPTSLQAIWRLLPVAEGHRLLLILTLRSEPSHASYELLEPANRSAAEGTTVVRLETLRPGEDRALLVELVGRDVLPDDLAERVLDACGGNPLHLEELIRSLIDAGALLRKEGEWRVGREVEIEIPTSLGKVLVARIDRLEEGCRQVLTAASVLGRRFEPPLLNRVVERPEGVREQLAELSRLDLIRPLLGSVGYAFKHALIQEAAYGTLLLRRRRELHRRAAAAMESLYAEELDEHAGVLAIHHRRAGQLEEALDWHRRAARSALAVSAQQEALRHLDDALAIGAEIGLADDDGTVVGLTVERGRIRSRTGDFSGARRDLERARAGARSSHDRIAATNELGFLLAGAADYREGLRLLGEALELAERSDDLKAQVSIRARISIARTNLLDLSGAFEAASAALEGARREGDEGLLAQALDAILLAAVMVGDFATTEPVADELGAIHRRRGDLWLLQHAVFQSCWAPLAACRFDEASARIAEAQAVAERIGDRGSEPIYLATRSWLHRSRGEYQLSLGVARRGVQAADELDHPEWRSWTKANLARTLLEVGATDLAIAELTAARDAADRSGSRIAQLRCLGLLARAMASAGDLAAASERAGQTLALLSEVRHPPGRVYLQGADASIAVAEALAELGREGGERWAREVIEAADAAGWLEMSALARLALGACLERTRGDQAIAAYTQALDIATMGGLAGARWRAHARLSRVGVDPDRNDEDAASIVAELRSTLADDSIGDALGAVLDAELEPRRRVR